MPVCEIKCKEGSKIFGLPWIINCKCEEAPKCAIEACVELAELKDCKCVMKEKEEKEEKEDDEGDGDDKAEDE